MSSQPSRMPTLFAFVLVLVALIVAAATGFGSGSIAGAVIAVFAIVPAAWGMWTGIQEKTQAGLTLAILAFLCALAVAGLLIVLKIVDWMK